MRNRDELTCEVIQTLLITGEADSLDSEMAAYCSHHLEECADCRAIQKETAVLAHRLQQKPEADLAAGPAIHAQLMQKMQHKRSKSFSLTRWFTSLRDLLNRRIPVYQAALATGFVLLIIFLTINFPVGITPEHIDTTETESIEFLYDDQGFVLQALQISDSQKIGINVKEDTMFTRFIYTTM